MLVSHALEFDTFTVVRAIVRDVLFLFLKGRSDVASKYGYLSLKLFNGLLLYILDLGFNDLLAALQGLNPLSQFV